ncbi:MAG TPA: M50 family metallopeptidase [Blastocatellia bacterium]|nr:M50 family metallopeptidase [Blastocatellia bacterium]
MQDQSEVKDSFSLLIISSIITIVLWFIPFLGFVTYPFRLFVTFIHEAGHALAALASLGAVNQIEVYLNGSGITETIGGSSLLISSAGYLTTAVMGSGLLLFLRRARNARVSAIGTSLLLLFVTLFFGGSLLTWVAGLALGGGLMWLGVKGRPKLSRFMMSFLAIQLLLNAFYDLKTLMYISAFEPMMGSDAQNMSAATGGLIPAVVWAVGWTLISSAILALTLIVYYKSLRKPAELLDYNAPFMLEDPAGSKAEKTF